MAKITISNADLVWIFTEKLKSFRDVAPAISIAIVPNKVGWTAIASRIDRNHHPRCAKRIEQVQRELREIKFGGLGFFPPSRKPRVLWAGIAGWNRLEPLAADVESALERIGIPREQRPFSPHLTLARFDPPGIDVKLSEAIAQKAHHVFGSMRAREFHLIESKLKPSSAEYTTVQTFPFAEAEA